MTEWQSIETAPHDQDILAAYAPTGGILLVHWFDADGTQPDGFYNSDNGAGPWKLTHWMPLPPPPVAP